MSEKCTLCPRKCGADRSVTSGFCGASDKLRIARAALHFWEEPCISGTKGSGTIFFSGCPLKCCFCQNYKISAEAFGKEVKTARLAEIMLELQEKGAHNINLVTATPYVYSVIEALDSIKDRLTIPVVYNSGGYENVETLKLLDGYIDVYLPDMKYMSADIAKKYSAAYDYPDVARKAIAEMYSQVGAVRLDKDGIIRKGVIVRHLALPSHRKDTESVLHYIAESFEADTVKLSLMSQYTPCYRATEFPEISRRISTYEYRLAVETAISLGLDGYMQERSSAKEEYTPPFDLEGV